MLRATRIAAALLFLSSGTFAQERWDHRGAVGLLAAVGGEVRASNSATQVDNGLRGDVDLGGTVSFTDRTELLLLGRLSLGGAQFFSLTAGIRSGYQLERWRTFFDLSATVHFGSLWTVGPRVAVGVQYELHPLVGLYSTVGGQIGWGAGLRLVGEVSLGVQLRSYLLE